MWREDTTSFLSNFIKYCDQRGVFQLNIYRINFTNGIDNGTQGQ